jgi:hypothetical protein
VERFREVFRPTGLFLLKLVPEMMDVKFEELLARAFQEVGFTGGGQVAAPSALEAMRRRRTKIVLFTFPGVLALSVLLTLTGMLASLWHMAWWITVAFVAVTILSLLIVILVVRASQQATINRPLNFGGLTSPETPSTTSAWGRDDQCS